MWSTQHSIWHKSYSGDSDRFCFLIYEYLALTFLCRVKHPSLPCPVFQSIRLVYDSLPHLLGRRSICWNPNPMNLPWAKTLPSSQWAMSACSPSTPLNHLKQITVLQCSSLFRSEWAIFCPLDFVVPTYALLLGNGGWGGLMLHEFTEPQPTALMILPWM